MTRSPEDLARDTAQFLAFVEVIQRDLCAVLAAHEPRYGKAAATVALFETASTLAQEFAKEDARALPVLRSIVETLSVIVESAGLRRQ